jgi:glutamate-1-semialdehyde 2,1-aminomutase
MRLLAPEGDVYQAGTFSGNPVCVNAGLTALKILSERNPYGKIGELTDRLCKGIARTAKEHGFKIKINHIGSMFTVFFSGRDVVDYDTAGLQDTVLFKKFYHGLLKEGVYLSPSGFEANFLSVAHTIRDVEKTLSACDKTLARLSKGL